MDYLERPEGYEPLYPPYRPSQHQSPIQQRSVPSKGSAPQQTVKSPVKMPKARAQAIARRMKQGIVVGSLLCFGTIGGVIIHQTDVSLAQSSTTQTTAKSTTTSSSSSQGSTTSSQGSSQQTGTSSQTSTPAATSTSTAAQGSTSSSQNSGSTQSGQASTTSQQGGGYGFGSTSSKTSVSGSHTS